MLQNTEPGRTSTRHPLHYGGCGHLNGVVLPPNHASPDNHDHDQFRGFEQELRWVRHVVVRQVRDTLRQDDQHSLLAGGTL